MTKFEPQQPDSKDPPSLLQEVASSVKDQARTSLRWAAWGAGLGATVLGVAGFWFFAPVGFAIGAALGALVGGLGAWFVYVSI